MQRAIEAFLIGELISSKEVDHVSTEPEYKVTSDRLVFHYKEFGFLHMQKKDEVIEVIFFKNPQQAMNVLIDDTIDSLIENIEEFYSNYKRKSFFKKSKMKNAMNVLIDEVKLISFLFETLESSYFTFVLNSYNTVSNRIYFEVNKVQKQTNYSFSFLKTEEEQGQIHKSLKIKSKSHSSQQIKELESLMNYKKRLLFVTRIRNLCIKWKSELNL